MTLHDLARELAETARQEARQVLLEPEVYALLAAAGLPVPRHAVVDRGAPPPFPGPWVLKVVDPGILHKSDVGGVVLADAWPQPLPRALGDRVLVVERVRWQGPELLVGLRQAHAFGPVMAVGFGGTAVEVLGPLAPPALSAPGLTEPAAFRRRLEGSLFFRQATGGVRGVAGVDDPDGLFATLNAWGEALARIVAALAAAGAGVAEVEVNPLVHAGRWLPLDGLLRLAPLPGPRTHPDPERLYQALSPTSLAVIGASRRRNVGRIILDTVLAGGFDRSRLWAIHPSEPEISGIPAVPSVAALPSPVDLLVVAVAADQVPGVVADVVASGRARGLLLIPGGMGETEGGQAIAEQTVQALDRAPADTRPVLIGNNSVGLLSRVTAFDSLFIPHDKLPRAPGPGAGTVALVSQSGAFAISRMSKLAHLGVRYLASIGNQLDACISDVVAALAADPAVRTFGIYVEGLQPGDGARLVPVVRGLAGRDVVVYKGGRSAAGARAAAGHTASVAGDYRVFASLLEDAGALVADDFDEFMDLLGLSAALQPPRGRRTALVSNAGYESVGMADHLPQSLSPATFSAETRQRVGAALEAAGIAHLVAATNPLDLTPMAGEQVYEAAVAAVLDDPAVDLAVIANVPLTPALRTLAAEAMDAPDAWAARMLRLVRSTDKPVVFVIDSGEPYDPLARFLAGHGRAVFRSADRAVRVLGRWVENRLRFER